MEHPTRQYRPVSTSEVAALDGLSVRAIKDIADAIGNYALYVGAPKLISEAFVPPLQSRDTSTDEVVLLPPWAGRLVPDGFTKLAITAGHYRTAGAGSVVWTLYCSSGLYKGPEAPFDATYLPYGYSSKSWTTSSDTHAIFVDDDELLIRRNKKGLVYLLLTADASDSSTRAGLTSLDVTAVP